MSERINHAARARIERDALNDVLSDEGITDASIVATAILVQVHATLALVEQQRIANLIALHRHEVKYDIGSWSRLYDEGEELRPEIKEALGIE